VPLEILYVAFMLFGRSARLEGTKITPLASFWIDLAGIEPVFARGQFSDHDVFSKARLWAHRFAHKETNCLPNYLFPQDLLLEAVNQTAVCTENPIRVDDVTESPKLAE
jgi:hypothetical protein